MRARHARTAALWGHVRDPPTHRHHHHPQCTVLVPAEPSSYMGVPVPVPVYVGGGGSLSCDGATRSATACAAFLTVLTGWAI
jgi:hypothetical protein